MTRMISNFTIGIALAATCGVACAASTDADTTTGLRVSVTNPTHANWDSVPVVLRADKMRPLNVGRGAQGEKFVVQNDDLDGDGLPDEMVFPVSLKAGETKTVVLSIGDTTGIADPPRAHAGMYAKTSRLRGFEGPGWESDMVGFRLYWDERNASDVFAKTTSTLSLDNLARSDVDYHHLTPWGMDVLKVGTSIGIGGFGVMIDGKVEKVADAKREFVVRADGPYRAVCDLMYTDWRVAGRTLELTARMKICGGQDYAECDLSVNATDGKPLPEMVCGFVKHAKSTALIEDPSVAMVGRWGDQALGEGETPMGGNLGLAVMTDPAEMERITEDDVNDLIILKPDGKATFRYLVDWYKDPHPASSAKQFGEMMRQTAAKKPIVRVESAR